MNRFIIHEGLPYLYADGKTYAVRWDDNGFTVGAEVDLTSAPNETFEQDWPEISILAKCETLDSMGVGGEAETEVTDAETEETEAEGFEKMTVAELKEFAAENGIELKSKVKADIIDELKAAL